MSLVVASGEFPGGNVLTFKAFPTHPADVNFVLTFHVEGAVNGGISYRVRKWEEVILETEPLPFHLPDEGGRRQVSHADSIRVAFPSQGAYQLDFVFEGAVLHSLPFSVFDSSTRTELEREIVYYLKSQRKAKSVKDITRGVFNPKLLNRSSNREYQGKVYFALLRMGDVEDVSGQEPGTLEQKMNSSRWKLKDQKLARK